MNTSGWSSLEIVKVVISALVPLSVAGVGWWLARLGKRLDAAQWLNQKVIEKRIAILDEVAPLLNDIYCYFTWRGTWKELSPLDVIERKRTLGRAFSINAPYLSAASLDAWRGFEEELFFMRAGPGKDAQPNTWISTHDGDRVAAYGAPRWIADWDSRFTRQGNPTQEETKPVKSEVKARYDKLLASLGKDIGARPHSPA